MNPGSFSYEPAMLRLIIFKSACVADHACGFIVKPGQGGGPVNRIGSADVGEQFKFPADGGGIEKFKTATSDALGRKL